MKWLSLVGKILITGTKLITGLGPTLFPAQSGAIGRISDTLERITDIVIGVEAFGQVLNISGPDKLRAAVPLATQVFLKSDLLIGKKIGDPILFAQGVKKVVDGIADILNSIKDDVDTQDIT